MKSERFLLPTLSPPKSLCWSGEELVDWAAGGLRHHLDGRTSESHIRYSYRFDAAVMSPDGRYAVLYERLGTKGLLLREGEVVRELNRSFYHADVYEYPVALCTLPSGRTLLAHCPEDYCRLELEDAETGERLTRRDSDPADIFHSRLQFSRDGRWLLSAGWIWHPVDAACVFDVSRALEQPASLDRPGDLNLLGEDFVECQAAAFGARDTVLLGCSDFGGPAEGEHSRLVVYSLLEQRELSRVTPQAPLGTLMGLGEYAVSFLGHPRLLELATGRGVEEWPELDTGLQSSSIIHHLPKLPPLALDPQGRRFAVGTEKGIEVIRFSP